MDDKHVFVAFRLTNKNPFNLVKKSYITNTEVIESITQDEGKITEPSIVLSTKKSVKCVNVKLSNR